MTDNKTTTDNNEMLQGVIQRTDSMRDNVEKLYGLIRYGNEIEVPDIADQLLQDLKVIKKDMIRLQKMLYE